jgi:predicted DNA-binding protein with PD1-like motif
MEYGKARLGRIFLLKFSDGDALVEEIRRFAKKEKAKTCFFFFLGALKKGKLVCGPKSAVIPPQPNFFDFKNGWDVVGTGSIFTNRSGPQVHIHTAMGQKNKSMVGCVREGSKVFIVLEAVVFELKGIKATKEIDPRTGINLLRIL